MSATLLTVQQLSTFLGCSRYMVYGREGPGVEFNVCLMSQ